MDINKRLIDLFEKLDNSDLADKAELKAEVKCCIDAMMHYFSVVSDEQLHCLEKTNNNLTSFMMLEKKRSESHDDAINACSRINNICHEVKLDDVFDFDTTDRRKVAEACGLLAGELYFSNLDNEITLKDYVAFADRNLYDTECFAFMANYEFNKLTSFFRKEFTRWCMRKFEEYDGDYDRLSRDICQLMNNTFQTPSKEMAELIPILDPSQVEKIIRNNSTAGNYRYEQVGICSDIGSDKWVLTKKGGSRKLEITLKNHGYILLCDYTARGWSLNAYSLDVLDDAIFFWAANRM